MKKILRMLFIAALSLIMVFGMAACDSGPTEEQSVKMEELMTRYETIVADCEKEFDKISETVSDEDIASIQESLDKVKKLVAETREGFDANKSTYTEEKADEVIASFKDQIQKSETFLKSLQVANAALG